MRKENIGQLAFTIGVIAALVAGLLLKENATVGLLLLILGVVVGLINITEKETLPYLVAAVALLISGNALIGILDEVAIPGRGAVAGMLQFLIAFTAPAAVIGALRSVYSLAARA